MSPDPILRIDKLVVQFGGLRAVDIDELAVEPEEIVGIIGPNGAGKTTLFDAISGFVRPASGTVTMAGRDITGMSVHARAARGLGRSFQNAELFPTLTVVETLAIAQELRLAREGFIGAALRAPWARRLERRTKARSDELITTIGLDAFAEKFVNELSTGTRRLVDLACVLAREPTVLLLDEPSSGIAQREIEELGDMLRRVQARLGCTVVIIEHDIPLLRSLVDRLYALETGRVISVGPPGDVLADPQVIDSYLGTDATVIERSGPTT